MGNGERGERREREKGNLYTNKKFGSDSAKPTNQIKQNH